MSSSRLVKKIERPRPLKLGNTSNRLSAIELSTVDDVLSLLESIAKHLSQNNYDPNILRAIPNLSMSLKIWGPQLEQLYKDQLDKLQVALRNACRDETLDLVSRLHLLEIIELRAMNWQPNENVTNYYKQKLAQIEQQDPNRQALELAALNVNAPDFTPTPTPSGSQSAPILGPGDVLKPSGKFARPTKIPGKNYVKDEVVIKNADSGKVMGLKGRRVHMIEELSETVISFQRVVPGAKERLVQITGPGENNVEQAKALMEETIRKNQSPIRETNELSQVSDVTSSEDQSDSRRNTLIMEVATIGEFKYTVNVGEEAIKIFGNNPELVRTAKIVLDDYFSQHTSRPAAPSHQDRMSVDDEPESTQTRRSSDSSNSMEPLRLPPGPKCNVLREPLFPGASKEAFQLVDSCCKKHIRIRRANFFRTLKEKKAAVAHAQSVKSSPPLITYDRKFLFECADSKASRDPPNNWENITMELPQIDRKVKSVHELPVDWDAVFRDDPLMKSAVLPHVNLKRSKSDPTAKAKKDKAAQDQKDQKAKTRTKTRNSSSEEEETERRIAPVISDKSVLLSHLKVDTSVEKPFSLDPPVKDSSATRS